MADESTVLVVARFVAMVDPEASTIISPAVSGAFLTGLPVLVSICTPPLFLVSFVISTAATDAPRDSPTITSVTTATPISKFCAFRRFFSVARRSCTCLIISRASIVPSPSVSIDSTISRSFLSFLSAFPSPLRSVMSASSFWRLIVCPFFAALLFLLFCSSWLGCSTGATLAWPRGRKGGNRMPPNVPQGGCQARRYGGTLSCRTRLLVSTAAAGDLLSPSCCVSYLAAANQQHPPRARERLREWRRS
mmetsp:Transcript_4977/g.13926  ORF Transcript_4977/g.13926 Transcript_4977/m.13926 type:complete len:249 (+) Transcript_4977:1250-1996(+)